MTYARITTTTTTTLRPAPRQNESGVEDNSSDELTSSAGELISTTADPTTDASVNNDDEGRHDHTDEIDKMSPNQNHCASFPGNKDFT